MGISLRRLLACGAVVAAMGATPVAAQATSMKHHAMKHHAAMKHPAMKHKAMKHH